MPLPPWAVAGLIFVLGLCLAVIGFFLRQVYTKVDEAVAGRIEIKEALAGLRLALELALKDTRATIYQKLDSIKEGVNLINNRVGKLETWSEQHEKLDDTNHGQAIARLDDHHQRLGQLERRQWKRERLEP